jgi:hypothetical protein
MRLRASSRSSPSSRITLSPSPRRPSSSSSFRLTYPRLQIQEGLTSPRSTRMLSKLISPSVMPPSLDSRDNNSSLHSQFRYSSRLINSWILQKITSGTRNRTLLLLTSGLIRLSKSTSIGVSLLRVSQIRCLSQTRRVVALKVKSLTLLQTYHLPQMRQPTFIEPFSKVKSSRRLSSELSFAGPMTSNR